MKNQCLTKAVQSLADSMILDTEQVINNYEASHLKPTTLQIARKINNLERVIRGADLRKKDFEKHIQRLNGLKAKLIKVEKKYRGRE